MPGGEHAGATEVINSREPGNQLSSLERYMEVHGPGHRQSGPFRRLIDNNGRRFVHSPNDELHFHYAAGILLIRSEVEKMIASGEIRVGQVDKPAMSLQGKGTVLGTNQE